MENVAKKIIKLLSKQDMNITQIANSLNLERHTIAKVMQGLKSSKDVVQKEKGRAKVYSLAQNSFLENILSNTNSSKQLNQILNEINQRFSIQDLEYNIIWNNMSQEYNGKKCYKTYANRDTPCPKCPAQKTITNNKINEANTNMGKIKTMPLANANGKINAIMEITLN